MTGPDVCEREGGEYQGDGTVCDEVECVPPPHVSGHLAVPGRQAALNEVTQWQPSSGLHSGALSPHPVLHVAWHTLAMQISPLPHLPRVQGSPGLTVRLPGIPVQPGQPMRARSGLLSLL